MNKYHPSYIKTISECNKEAEYYAKYYNHISKVRRRKMVNLLAKTIWTIEHDFFTSLIRVLSNDFIWEEDKEEFYSTYSNIYE